MAKPPYTLTTELTERETGVARPRQDEGPSLNAIAKALKLERHGASEALEAPGLVPALVALVADADGGVWSGLTFFRGPQVARSVR